MGIRSPLQYPVLEDRKGMRIATAPAGLRNDGGSIWGVPKAAGKLKVESGKRKVESGKCGKRYFGACRALARNDGFFTFYAVGASIARPRSVHFQYGGIAPPPYGAVRNKNLRHSEGAQRPWESVLLFNVR